MVAGPWSPPIASMAIRGPLPTYRFSLCRPAPVLRLDGPDFTSIIMAAGGAEVVRKPELAAIRAFLVIGRLQRVMAAAHVALRRRGFSLGDSHPGTCSNKLGFACGEHGAKGQRRVGRGPWGAGRSPLAGRPIKIFRAVANAAAARQPRRPPTPRTPHNPPFPASHLPSHCPRPGAPHQLG